MPITQFYGFFRQFLPMRAISRHIFWKEIDFAFIFSFLGISDPIWPGKNIRHRFWKKNFHDPVKHKNLASLQRVLPRGITEFELMTVKFACREHSTPRRKTDKLEEPVNRELDVTRSWNLIQTVDLAWFIPRMSFKLICIFYDFKAPLLENR